MMNQVCFCKDGILRISHAFFNDEKNKRKHIYVPVLEGFKEDPGYFLSILNKDVRLEEGLTLKDFFENLKPFSSFISYMAHINFDKYYQEILKDADTSIDVSDISHLEVSYSVLLRNLDEVDNKDSLFPYVDTSFNFSGVYKEKKPIKNTDSFDEKCSLMFVPVSNIASLELKLNNQIDINCSGKEYKRFNVDLNSINFFDFVVKGVLWDIGFFGPPENRDMVGDDLKKSVEEIKDEDCKTFDIDEFLEDMKNIPEPDIMSDEEFWQDLETDNYLSERDKNSDQYFIDLLRSMNETSRNLVKFSLK